MNAKSFVLILLLLGFKFTLKAESFLQLENDSAFYYVSNSNLEIEELVSQEQLALADNLQLHKDSKLALKYAAAFHENKRLTAAMLTFALGMLGVHRLYLGTKPWIPAVYLLTFGGGFLILPLIDLGVILFSKDISQYEHNDRVLMWVK